jgi:hypothetical protein
VFEFLRNNLQVDIGASFNLACRKDQNFCERGAYKSRDQKSEIRKPQRPNKPKCLVPSTTRGESILHSECEGIPHDSSARECLAIRMLGGAGREMIVPNDGVHANDSRNERQHSDCAAREHDGPEEAGHRSSTAQDRTLWI